MIKTQVQNDSQNPWIDAEEILAPFPTLNSFLESQEGLEKYFQWMDHYFCHQFSWAEFQRLIEQVREVAAQLPILGEKLWRANDSWGRPETLAFGYDCLHTSSLNFDPQVWMKFVELWKKDLRQAWLGDPNDLSFSQKRIEEIPKLLLPYCLQLQEFKNQLALRRLNLKARHLAERDFFKELENQKVLSQTAILLVYSWLQDLQTQSVFESENGNFIMQCLEFMRSQPAKLLPKSMSDSLPPLVTLLQKCIPKVSDLRAEKMLFPDRSRTGGAANDLRSGHYQFAGIPRRFHGIFRGHTVKDCLGMTLGTEDHLTPLRWGISAFDDSMTYYMRNEHSYFGAVQITPIRRGNEIWGLMEFWASALCLRPVLRGEESKSPQYFIEHLLRQVEKQKPVHWRGLCLAMNDSFDNHNVQKFIAHSCSYLLEKTLGPTEDFRCADPLADELAAKISRKGRILDFSKGVITPLTRRLDVGAVEVLSLKSMGVN